MGETGETGEQIGLFKPLMPTFKGTELNLIGNPSIHSGRLAQFALGNVHHLADGWTGKEESQMAFLIGLTGLSYHTRSRSKRSPW